MVASSSPTSIVVADQPDGLHLVAVARGWKRTWSATSSGRGMTSIPPNAADLPIRGGESVSDEVSDDDSEVVRDDGWYGVNRVLLSAEPDTAVLPW